MLPTSTRPWRSWRRSPLRTLRWTARDVLPISSPSHRQGSDEGGCHRGRNHSSPTDSDQSHDRVASLEPPVPERVDLAADWKELRDWATARIARLTAESAAAEQLIEDLQRRLSEQEGSLTALVEEEGLNAESRPTRDVIVDALAGATRTGCSTQVDCSLGRNPSEHGHHYRVCRLAESLGRHLSATGFEAWLMEEALAALVAGANGLLDELADGAYSLEVVRRDFRVVRPPQRQRSPAGQDAFRR